MKNYTIHLLAFLLIASIGGCKQSKFCKRNDGSGNGVAQEISCQQLVLSNNPINGAGGTFNTQKFLTELGDSLDACTGYQIAVVNNGLLIGVKSGGLARKEADCLLYMNDCNKINIASQTKTITAAAVLKLLEANGLTVDSLVYPYLPASWAPFSDYVKGLRFRHFLAHRSALSSYNSNFPTTLSYNGIKTFIASTPVDSLKVDNNPDNNIYKYMNANFALMRIVIPALWKNLPDAPDELKNASEITSALSAKYYAQYAKDKLLIPSLVVDATLAVSVNDDERTLYYKSSVNAKGKDFETDWTGITGGGGWFMSATDMARYAYSIDQNDAILSPANRLLMRGHPTLNWPLGFFNSRNTPQGMAYGHAGDLSGDEGDMHGCIMFFPNGIYVCAMINSENPSGGSIWNSAVAAYNNAWL